MKEKEVDITGRFDMELSEINYILTSLENGRYYENTGARMDGTIPHNIEKLRKELNGLLSKIQYGKQSDSEEIGDIFFGGSDESTTK